MSLWRERDRGYDCGYPGVGLIRRKESAAHDKPQGVAGKGALSVGSVMLASSGDTFSALIAVFADTADRYTVPMLATVALAALCWCGLAAWLRSHPVLERPLSNLARYVIPFLLIGIGIYILMDSGTDVVVG